MFNGKGDVRRVEVRECNVWKIGIASLSISARAVVATTTRLNTHLVRFIAASVLRGAYSDAMSASILRGA